MRSFKLLLVLVPLLTACSRPATEALRRQPCPPLSLELSLPDEGNQAELKRVYTAAFHSAFGKGLVTSPEENRAPRIQLLVLIGTRGTHSSTEATVNRRLDQAGAVASANPVHVLGSFIGPKSDYENAVQALGYRPSVITGQAVVLKAGKDGFQESVKLDPMPIIYRMRPLGEEARAHGGIEEEEARAVALQTLDLLEKKFGWAPPSN